MAKGESRYNPADRQVKRFKNEALPTNDYTLQSKMAFQTKVSAEPGSVPYVFGTAFALGTKKDDDPESKDRTVMMPLYTQITPEAEGKTPSIDQGGQLTELIQTLHLTLPEDIVPMVVMKGTGEEAVEVEILPPKKVAEWLNSLGAFVVRTHVKKRPAKPPYDESNQIGYFIEDEVNHVDGQEVVAPPKKSKK